MISNGIPKFIYFIKPVGADGPIKIGATSVVKRRLYELTLWSPCALEIMAFVAGDHKQELALHRLFKASRSHNEWFHTTPALVAVVARVAGGESVASVLDDLFPGEAA